MVGVLVRDTNPPDISNYVDSTGKLQMSIPMHAEIRTFFQHKNGNYKSTFCTSVTQEDGSISISYALSFYDVNGDVLDDFLDEDDDFIPVTYTNGSVILREPTSTGYTNSASYVDQSALLQSVTIALRNAVSSSKDLPALRVWDGNPISWYSFKDNLINRLSATGVKYDSTTLTSYEDQSIYNLIHANTKRGDNEYGTQVSVVFVLSNRNKGSAVFAALVDVYERHNVHYLKTLKRKLSGMKLSSFRTTGRRSHDLYNVEDFYNSIDIDIIKYTEAGGTWSEDQKLRMWHDW